MNIEEKDIKRFRQELLFSRIVGIFSLLTTFGLLVCGILLYNKFQRLSEETEYIIENVSEIEMDDFNLSLITINKLIENVNNVLESVDWIAVSDKVTQLDVEALNNAIGGLDVEAINKTIDSLDVEALNKTIDELDVEALNKAIDGLDTRELSEAVKNLNAAVEKVRELSETLSRVKSLFENFKLW